jgi:DNA-binding CsgD family transcriptional regulator
MEIDSKLGICIKTNDSTVTYQNEKCVKLCGNQISKKCNDSCMSNYQLEAPIIINQGMKLIKNSNTTYGKADAVVINDGETITTILYDLDEKTKNIQNSMEEFKNSDLTKSELTVIELILQGFTKKEITKKLFVSEATIKTHLNNIYKKLPSKWQLLKNRRD